MNADDKNLYAILEIEAQDIRNVSATAIEKAYDLLAQQYHPDNLDVASSEPYLLLTRAYTKLIDEDVKTFYDAWYIQHYKQHHVTKEDVETEKTRKAKYIIPFENGNRGKTQSEEAGRFRLLEEGLKEIKRQMVLSDTSPHRLSEVVNLLKESEKQRAAEFTALKEHNERMEAEINDLKDQSKKQFEQMELTLMEEKEQMRKQFMQQLANSFEGIGQGKPKEVSVNKFDKIYSICSKALQCIAKEVAIRNYVSYQVKHDPELKEQLPENSEWQVYFQKTPIGAHIRTTQGCCFEFEIEQKSSFTDFYFLIFASKKTVKISDQHKEEIEEICHELSPKKKDNQSLANALDKRLYERHKSIIWSVIVGDSGFWASVGYHRCIVKTGPHTVYVFSHSV